MNMTVEKTPPMPAEAVSATGKGAKHRPSFGTRADGHVRRQPRKNKKTFEWTEGYRHCIYMNMPAGTRMGVITEDDLRVLGAFIDEQDRLRRTSSLLVGGFDRLVAIVTKVLPSSRLYKEGVRWHYMVWATHKVKTFKTRNLMLAELAREA